MGLLKDSDRENLRKQFEQLQSPVKLAFFTQALDCDYCPLTLQVLEEVADLSDKITLQTYNFAIDTGAVQTYKIERVPATAVLRVEHNSVDGKDETVDRDYGIRFYGVPAGFEFSSLLGDIIDVSAGDSGLTAESKAALRDLKNPIHMQVFTTPT